MEEINTPKLYSGLDTLKISKVNQFRIARQVYHLLNLYPNTLLANAPEEIVDFMNNGQVVMLIGNNGQNELIAYSRLHRWSGVNQSGQRLFEFRSWIVNPNFLKQGYGAYVLHQTVALGKGLDLNAQIIAVVEKRSRRALEVFQVAGGKFLERKEWPTNLKILLKGGEQSVKVVDITDINNYLALVDVSSIKEKLKKETKTILLSIGRITNKRYLMPFIKKLSRVKRFNLYDTQKTHQFLKENGIKTTLLFKISQPRSRPNIKQFLEQGLFDYIINIPTRAGKKKEITDGRIIRQLAVENEIPLVTDISVAEDFIKKLIRESK